MTHRGGGIIDKCGNEWIPIGSPIISSEQRKFYKNSYKGISGTNYHTDSPINFDIGTGDYTMEAWVYSLSYNQNAGVIQLSQYVGGLTTNPNRSICLCGYYNWHGDGYFNEDVTPVGRWSHKAIVRRGGFITLFVDGIPYPIRANNVDLSNLKYAVIGNYYNNGYNWSGYIDSIRVANHAIYTKKFVPRIFTDNKWLYITEDKKVYRMT